MNKYIEVHGLDTKLRLVMGAMNIQNGNYKKAQKYIHQVLESEWDNIQANLLMAFIYECIGRPGLQRKHFAIAKVKRMRELNVLQPKNNAPKNFRTRSIEYSVEIIDYKNVATIDGKMKPDDCDRIYFELIDFLLENTLFKCADIALGYI